MESMALIHASAISISELKCTKLPCWQHETKRNLDDYAHVNETVSIEELNQGENDGGWLRPGLALATGIIACGRQHLLSLGAAYDEGFAHIKHRFSSLF